MRRISNNYLYLLGGILIALSVAARIYSYPIVTPDFTDSIAHWMDALSTHSGLSAFKDPFSDYAPLYLYLLKLLTLLPVNALYAVKTLSVVFDIVLAFVVVRIVRRAAPERFGRAGRFVVFAVVFAIPTVLVNSSLWGQCDSIYTALTLASLLYILERKPFAASLCFAIAVCFKLQAIFFLPVLAGFLFTEKHRLAYFLIIPAVYVLLIIPALGGGGPLGRLLTVYFHQSGEYQALTLSAPTIFSFINNAGLSTGMQTLVSYAGIALALAVASIVLLIAMRAFGAEHADSKQIIFLSLFSVLAIPFLLPHMHERYFYLADIVSVAYAFYDPKRYYIPLAVILASLLSYVPFLSASIPVLASIKIDEAFMGVLMLLVLISLMPGMKALWKTYGSINLRSPRSLNQ